MTFSKSLVCAKCLKSDKVDNHIEVQQKQLLDVGYKHPVFVNKNETGHNIWKVITPCCGGDYSIVFGNFLKQLKLTGKPPCGTCGPRERMSKAIKGYVEKHGRTYDLQEYKDYCRKVRVLSDKNYKAFKDQINPYGFKRGKSKDCYHLDHKVSIIWCFKNNISHELAASVNNLQMLSVLDNLSKGRKNISDEEAFNILQKTSVEQQIINALGKLPQNAMVVNDLTNVFRTDVVTVRESEYLKRPMAVLGRLRYFGGELTTTIGARKLHVKRVDESAEREFLESNHIQGYAKSKEAFGLFDDGDLLSLMTFSVPRYKQSIADWELLRFCTKTEITVPGAAQKLFKHFLAEIKPTAVVSYSLNRWGTGKIYEILGFSKKSSNTSDMFFWKTDGVIRSWRASILMARRKGIEIKNKCIENTLKIADPGSTTWLFTT